MEKDGKNETKNPSKHSGGVLIYSSYISVFHVSFFWGGDRCFRLLDFEEDFFLGVGN